MCNDQKCSDHNPYTLPDIDFVGGETQNFSFNVYFYANGSPFDVGGCTANFSIVSYNNKTGAPRVSKEMTVAQGADSTSNVLKVTLSPSDTVDLSGKFIYQITIRDAGGDVEIPKQGIMNIINNINKPFTRG